MRDFVQVFCMFRAAHRDHQGQDLSTSLVSLAESRGHGHS